MWQRSKLEFNLQVSSAPMKAPSDEGSEAI